jgi:hypothetical protein
MVNSSLETPEQTEARLRRVFTSSRLAVFEGAYAFEEFPRASFNQQARAEAVAPVREGTVCRQVVAGIAT